MPGVIIRQINGLLAFVFPWILLMHARTGIACAGEFNIPKLRRLVFFPLLLQIVLFSGN
jgi:hypothetical protein